MSLKLSFGGRMHLEVLWFCREEQPILLCARQEKLFEESETGTEWCRGFPEAWASLTGQNGCIECLVVHRGLLRSPPMVAWV